jgi:pyruvate-formate lyase
VSKATVKMLKQPQNLSPRIKWLRDFYFKGRSREWNNEYLSFSTGTPWDILYDVTCNTITYEEVRSLGISLASAKQNGLAHVIKVPEGFYDMTIAERKAWFTKEVMVNHVPAEILPGDLLAGGRFNLRISLCLTKEETEQRERLLAGSDGYLERIYEYNNRGFGNLGPTPGHIIPGHEKVIRYGLRGEYEYYQELLNSLPETDKVGTHGGQLRAMMTSCLMGKELAEKYADTCAKLAEKANTSERQKELLKMATILRRVPWEPATTFWEAMMSLWITHMLIMADENYPGAGTSFGRLDQYLYPYWQRSLDLGMDREFGKEILKCFFIHCNTAYDAAIRVGNNQGITAGYGQLFSLSGMGKGGVDMTNDLTYALLEVIDDMTPILEPKPNVRLHKNSPEKLLDIVVDMISRSQGAPFLLNFDERSMAGMLREAKKGNVEHLINEDNVFDYASVGCLENTMVGNDRSETVNCNVILVKAVELALGNGKDLVEHYDFNGSAYPIMQDGPMTGDPRDFKTFDEFYEAFKKQLCHIIKKSVDLYNLGDILRAKYAPTPFLSVFVKGCAERGRDVVAGGAELRFCTIEGVSFATTVDSLLAIKYLVYENKDCTMDTLIKAIKANWEGYEILQAKAKNRAPKYGRDDDVADEMAKKVMDLWTEECWKYRTPGSDEQFRPGMLSWNYWTTYAGITFATPDGRKRGQFMSNAICPSNGVDINGPTANSNSVGKALGGKSLVDGDFREYKNSLPNGASHTITFNPSILRDPEHKNKFKAFLRGYIENGGTALQINILDADMLRDAQNNPEDYSSLLVRVTGYNAYFTTIGKELQDEIIARESHRSF